MRCKATHYLTRTIATVLVLAAASSSADSSSAALFFPFYVAGGLVNWSSADSTIDATSAFQGSRFDIPLDSVRSTSWENDWRIGAGYSFDETWSVEGSYVTGPKRYQKISGIPHPNGEDFLLVARSDLDFTVFRLNPVYEFVLRDPISVLLKAGIAQIRAEMESTTFWAHVRDPYSLHPEETLIKESRGETKPFAAAALKLNFRDGKIALVASLVQYFDAPGGLGQALELDLMWRF